MLNIPVINQQLHPDLFPNPSKAILVYASAHWCFPCRQFTPLLKMFYDLAKEARADVEVVFLSSDRTELDMANYFRESHGSWLAVPFFSPQRQFLSTHFNIRGIPSLILVNRGTMQAVDIDLRSVIQQLAMSRSPDRVKQVVEEWRQRSGAVLFETIPKSMCLLSKEQRASAFDLLTKVVSNVADYPTESKFRQLKADNAIVRKTILDLPCGDAPLAAVGFFKDGEVYSYRRSYSEPMTTSLILKNRDSNSLADLATTAPVPHVVSQTARLYEAPAATRVQCKFRIEYRDLDAVETEKMPFESLEVLSAITESISDVPAEYQRLFAPSVTKTGPLNGSTEESNIRSRFAVAATTSPSGFIDLVVMGQHSRVNPNSLRFEDVMANKEASELREKIIGIRDLGVPSHVMAGIFNAAIHAQIYEVPSHQLKALEFVPVCDIHAKARKRSSLVKKQGGSLGAVYEEALLIETLDWFKSDFYKWMDKPKCEQCSSSSTQLVNRSATPTPQEIKGLAKSVELYSCEVCGGLTRFPRFNHPVALLSTRTGRCGEWANCFALIARSLGFEVRKTFDSADHVWVEVWMDHRPEWVHCDPCENAYDKPLLYEQGWGKTATLTVAVGRDSVQDVTRRYTAEFEAFRERSKNDLNVTTAICTLNELLMTHSAENSGGDKEARLKALKKRSEEEDVFLNLLSKTNRKAGAASLGGRTTGSLEWRLQRDELGNGKRHEFFIGNDVDKIIATAVRGGEHGDTVRFSDEHFLRASTAGSGIPSISKISLWDDGKLVAGIKTQWRGLPDSGNHLGSLAEGKPPAAVLEFEEGEFVSSILVRVGTLLDFIEISTSKGRKVHVGNVEGGSLVRDCDFELKEGQQVIGFSGGKGGHLHSLGLLIGPAPAPVFTKADRIKEVFTKLVSEGMSPNDAAIGAIKQVGQ